MTNPQGGYAGQGYPPQAYQGGYATRRPGAALLAVGLVLALAGIVAGGALYVVGKERFSSRVSSLVTDSGALSGCVTDLAVAKPGTYTLYYISTGSLRINGANDGCSTNDVVPIAADPNPPDIVMSLRNPDGKKLKLSSPTSTAVLKAGGVVAEPYRQVNIGGTGDYSLEIAMPDTGLPFAIGIGGSIDEPSSLIAFVVGLVGVVLGAACGVLGAAQGGSTRRQRYGTGYPGYPPGYPPGYAPGNAQRPGGVASQRPGGPAPRGPQPAAGRPAPAPRPSQPPVQRPVPRQPGQPGQPGQYGQPGARPAGTTPVDPRSVAPTNVVPRQPGASASPGGAAPRQPGPPQPSAPQQPPQRPGALPRIVSSEDESGSLSTSPPTQRMPGTPPGATGWERETAPPPTRPLSSQRPVPPPESTEDPDRDD